MCLWIHIGGDVVCVFLSTSISHTSVHRMIVLLVRGRVFLGFRPFFRHPNPKTRASAKRPRKTKTKTKKEVTESGVYIF